MLGVDPGPFTWRRLVKMYHARRRDNWDHTASLLHMLYSAHAGPRARKLKVHDFHPMGRQRQRRDLETVMTKDNFNALKRFVHG